ncbi:MAG: hypothetical protein ACPGLY_09410 [Rubripirellula sp.]
MLDDDVVLRLCGNSSALWRRLSGGGGGVEHVVTGERTHFWLSSNDSTLAFRAEWGCFLCGIIKTRGNFRMRRRRFWAKS